MPFNPHRWIDDALLHTAEGAVHAYNWTTGGTKDELANYCVLAWTTLCSAGVALRSFRYPAIVMSGFLFAGYVLRRMNTETAQCERTAADKKTKDVEVEVVKSAYALGGPLFAATGGADLGLGFIINDEDALATVGVAAYGVGFLALSANCYIMRADDLPPRQSAWERAKEAWQARQLEPVPVSYR